MPAPNAYGEDRVAMVDALFAEQDAALIAKLKEKSAKNKDAQALRERSGIKDDGLIQRLLELEITAGTFTAMQMIPLIEVAWADGKMEAKEREAVLNAAAQHGISPGTPEQQLLAGWLDRKPTDTLLETWMQYTREIAEQLEPGERETLRHRLLDDARAVAEAAGGFLGMGSKISKEEEAMLKNLAGVF